MRTSIYFIVFFILFTGCQQQQHPGEELEKDEKEKVFIYVVDQDQSPVQNLQVGLGETGDSPDIGTILDPTDEDGKTEANLKVGVTYDIYFVIDDDTTQYEKITVSNNVEENEYIFELED